MPDEWSLPRKLGKEPIGEPAGPLAPLAVARLPAAAGLQEATAGPGARRAGERRVLGGRALVAPQQRDGQLGSARDATEGGAQLVAAGRERRRGRVARRERGAETHREAGLHGANALDETVVLERVVPPEPVGGIPLAAPEAKAVPLGPGERPSAQTRTERSGWGRGGDRVRQQAHGSPPTAGPAPRSSPAGPSPAGAVARSRVSTAEWTTVSPR